MKNAKKLLALLLAVVMVFALAACGGGSAKSVAEKAAKASTEGDAKTVVNMMHAKMVDAAVEEGGYDSKQDMIDEMQDMLDMAKGIAEEMYGEDYKVAAKATGEADLDEDELKEIQDNFKSELDLKVSDAKDVTVELTIKGDGDEETSDEMTMTVVKIGGKWYPYS